MGPKLIQHDNLDKVPPNAPHDSAPWAQPSTLIDWRTAGVLCAFALLLLLIAYWLFGADVRDWVRYGTGGKALAAVFALGFVYAGLMALRRVLLIEQRGYKVFVWNANSPRVVEQLIKVDVAYAKRLLPSAAQVTLTQAPQLPELDDDDVEEGELIDGPDIGPLAVEAWMTRLNEQPHAIFAAKTKGGKSTMAKVGLRPRIMADESIFVIDPHSNGWLNLPSVGGGLNWSEIEDAMATIATLYKNRMDEREYHMRHTGQELSQTHFPRLTVIFDEANESRTNIEARHKRGASPWQAFTEVMGSGSRKVGISLWLIAQSALIKNLGGSTVMRRNYTVFALDHATIRELIEDEEPFKDRRDAILAQIGGARFPAATVLEGQAFLLDRTNIDQLEPESARGCAWDGWDYDQRTGLVLPRKQIAAQPARAVVSASVRPSATVSAHVELESLLSTPVAPGRTPDGQRTRIYLKALAHAGRTRQQARDRMTKLGMPFENNLWTEVRRELGLD
jgi:hypothetical protein